jgi:hypothetical protein
LTRVKGLCEKTTHLIVTMGRVCYTLFSDNLQKTRTMGKKTRYNTSMPQTMRHPRQSGGSGIWKQNG